jgi:FAD/FMN-containing dehydrogenase
MEGGVTMAEITAEDPTMGLSVGTLREQVRGRVIGAADDDYDEARAVHNGMFDKRPLAVLRAQQVADVIAGVNFARENGLDLSLRDGGHSAPGFGTNDGGLVIDMTPMRTVHVDPRSKTARADAGATWGDFNHATHAFGLATTGGIISTTGITGLTLGGGIGYLSRACGLSIDNLISADVVTADGKFVTASERENEDLFWGLRGGGGNFGVVTRFRYQLSPMEGSIGGMLVLPATPDTIASFIEAAEEAPDELSTIANVMPAPPMPFLPKEQHGRLILLAMLFHAGPSDAGQQALAPFRALAEPLADFLRPLSYEEMYPPENGEQPPPATARTLFVDEVDRAVAAEILGRLAASSAQMPVAQLRVLGGVMARVPVEATAFAHRTRRIMVNVAAVHASRDEAPTHDAWVDGFVESLRRDGDAYVNFVGDEGRERVRASYPGGTWDRLRQVKRRYDPDNVFRVNHNIRPADELG